LLELQLYYFRLVEIKAEVCVMLSSADDANKKQSFKPQWLLQSSPFHKGSVKRYFLTSQIIVMFTMKLKSYDGVKTFSGAKK
jgi:hypothetical protein